MIVIHMRGVYIPYILIKFQDDLGSITISLIKYLNFNFCI